MYRLFHQESEESSKMALLIFILRFVLSGNIIAKYREQLISAVEENDNLLSVIERWFSPEAVSSYYFSTLFILPFFKVSYIHYSHIPSRKIITHTRHMHKNY